MSQISFLENEYPPTTTTTTMCPDLRHTLWINHFELFVDYSCRQAAEAKQLSLQPVEKNIQNIKMKGKCVTCQSQMALV